jgi:hypothetical protein
MPPRKQQELKRIGRPVQPVPRETADEIVEWIEQGKTLRDYCRQPGKPHYNTVYQWLDKDEEFNVRFVRAREVGYEALAQECQAIADENCLDQVDVGRNRLRVETRLKLLAKWWPQKYGDRQAVEHGGSVSLNVITGVPPRDATNG